MGSASTTGPTSCTSTAARSGPGTAERRAPGQIVVLNGAPRSGKSTIATAIQGSFSGVWMTLGVDAFVGHIVPAHLQPGIGLRPGGERPDLESSVPVLFAALYASVAAQCRLGLNVVVDVGHHDAYSRPLAILPDCARRLAGLPALLVGVRCPVEVIMARRRQGQAGRDGLYVTAAATDPVPPPVLAWQRAVHVPGIYDLEVDTGTLSPEACAAAIAARLRAGPGTAFARLAAGG